MRTTARWLITFTAAVCSLAAADQNGQENVAGQPALQWSISGGIAGFCDELSVFRDGNLRASTCKFGARHKTGKLGRDDAAKIDRWRTSFGSVKIDNRDLGVNDSMTVTLKLLGTGKQQPSEADKARMLQWAQHVFNANRP